MTRPTNDADDTGEQDDRPSADRTTPEQGSDRDGTAAFPSGGSRRDFLKATAGASAVAAGIGFGVSGSASAGIPTPWLERDGNLIRDPSGNEVILRGVNIPDLKRLNSDNYYSYSVEEYITWATNGNSPPGTEDENGWYSRVIRLPCQPVDIGGHDPGAAPPAPAFDQGQIDSYVENHLRPAVETCAEQGVYAIVDYHRHRGEHDETLHYTSDEIDEEIRMFWETVAPEFAEDSHVLYELYNEPTAPYADETDPTSDSESARDTWATWKEAAQPWVDLIRERAPRNLVLIGSPRWSQWTAQAPNDEFEGDNLAYTGHVYGQENMRPLSESFGAPGEEVPVFMTEWGYKNVPLRHHRRAGPAVPGPVRQLPAPPGAVDLRLPVDAAVLQPGVPGRLRTAPQQRHSRRPRQGPAVREPQRRPAQRRRRRLDHDDGPTDDDHGAADHAAADDYHHGTADDYDDGTADHDDY